MMKDILTLCRVLFFVTLVLELGWLKVGHSMHRAGGIVEANQNLWERQVRSASSLDELLSLTQFPDRKLWKCRLRLQQPETQTELVSSSLSSSSAGSHRSTRYASDSYSLEILKAIDEEWQRTQCIPRETCVDVAKELGTDPSMFFKPPCVSVYRCNGCCNTEGVTCRNTTTTYVNKTLLSVIPYKFGPEPVLIKVANHTECKCMEPAIIRRHARPHRRSVCSPHRQTEQSRRLCASGLIWDCMSNRCVPYPSSQPEFQLRLWMPDCDIDVESCDCLPTVDPSRSSDLKLSTTPVT